MNAYKFTIRYAVYHNDKFSHNVDKYKTIHTEFGVIEATKQIYLNKGETIKISENFIIKTFDEYIAYTEFLGKPILRTYYEYEK
jgi:hypothetical protein